MRFIERDFSPRTLFIVKFGSLTLGLFTLFFFLRQYFNFLLNWTAAILGFLLRIFAIQNVVSGESIAFSGVNFEIIYACTALFPIIIFISAVIAYKSNWKEKGFGILIGVPLIYALNVIRLLVLSFIGLNYPSAFKVVHSFLWESIFLIFVILMFVFWVRKVDT